MKARLIKRFEDEIATYEHELNHELPKEIQRARELGDLRENAEYHAAKERQTFVQTRVSMLRQRVAELQLMNLDRIPHGKAGFGSKITVSENGKTSIYELVMPEDANPESGLISLASPLGRAFANKEEGDEVVVATPSGEREFAIISLTTIHEE
jgi:transcription elongation factor GreA